MGGFDGYYQMSDKLIADELQWNIRFEAWWIGVFSEDCKNCLKHTQMLYYKIEYWYTGLITMKKTVH